MKQQEFCDAMGLELASWKAKIYDIIRKVDKLGTEERGKILANVQDMHMLVEDMETRIHELERECPTEWHPYKRAVDEAHVDMRAKYEETMKYIGEAAPFSVPG
jgi:hypothetical protein